MDNELAERARRFAASSPALHAALAEDPFYATLEALADHPEGRRAAMLSYYEYSMLEAERFGLLCLTDTPGAGAAVWSLPLDDDTASQKKRDKAAMLRACIGKASCAAYDAINVNMAKGTLPLVDPSDWYLSILGLDPSVQGQGKGSALLAPVLARADAAGVGCYLETFTPRNMRFYQRLGFVAVGTFHEPVTDAEYHVMRRPVRGF
ncbi:GNAT family N-acetyltransferase [Lutimaribacter marinistellae]|uniref:GNAT family N-acetyltransferase n=1 Tax=Lutimaribacter marinistellae TaxID=1820329 RepID=A0ABV7TCX5_9RHOB